MLTIGLLRASLPSYFPERHGVWARAEAALATLCDAHGARLIVLPDIPMNGIDTTRALNRACDDGVDFILCLHGGFTMGDVARTIAASPFRAGFWSVPEPVRTGDVQLNNFVSLNMSLSIARGVRDLRSHPVQWYHGAPESPALQLRLSNTIRALTAVKALNGARIGVIGGLAMTFYNMEVSSAALMTRMGVSVAHHNICELTGRMAAIPSDRIGAEHALMTAKAPVRGVSQAQMDLTARCALALRDIAGAGGYAGLAVSDWPALQTDPGMHPGAAFSWLEEVDNMAIASEGDVLGVVTQLVARSVTGRVGALLDMTEPDLDSGHLLMWHGGGGPLYLADQNGAAWINHPMIGRGTAAGPIYGAIADFVFAPGPVTVFRVARDAGALFQATATVEPRDPSGFDGCRGWLRDFHIGQDAASLQDVVATVMAHGLEHHFILVPGNHASVLAEFGSWAGMTALARCPMRDHLDASDFS
jgi:L-fucose isomerase-like protein